MKYGCHGDQSKYDNDRGDDVSDLKMQISSQQRLLASHYYISSNSNCITL